VVFLAKYRVVELTQLEAEPIPEVFEPERIKSILGEFCPAGWEVVSARTLEDNGIQKALVLLSR
jgi:hypothetical protein